MPVVAGFDTTFTFRITPPTGATRAEGMAFLIQDDPAGAAAVGGAVWSIGYGVNGSTGIRNCIAVELDTYQDTSLLGDTSANELTIHTRGPLGNNENEQYSIGRNTPATSMSNAQVHTLRVVYVPGSLDVYVDNAATPAIHSAYDLLQGGRYLNNSTAPGLGLTTGTAFAGFSATTGASGLSETVEILSWTWTSQPLTDPCYAGSFGTSPLTVEGSDGSFLRRVPLLSSQTFRVEMATPPGATPGMPFILLASLLPAPGAPGTALPFGNACFPMLPLPPSVLVIADSFGLLPALLPSTTTPWLLQLPPALLNQPIELTLQGVVASSLQPFSLGLTNAVTVAVGPAPTPVITTVSPASAAPGTSITVNGTGFVPGYTVELNGAPIAPLTATPTSCTFAYPAGLACGSQVTVRNPDGRQATGAINPVPIITSTALGTGPVAGGATFVVLGTGFAPGTTMTIGGVAATVTTATATSVLVRTPPGTPGQASVVVTTPGGCQATTSYTYQ